MTTAKTAVLSREFGITGLLAGVVALMALVATSYFFALPSEAATNFLIRGDVVKYDKTSGTVHVYFRHVNSAAEHFAGEVHEINVKNSKFYTYDSKQRKTAATFGTTLDSSGYEVVVSGTVDGSNNFKANWLVRNDNTVRLRGYVRGQSTASNYLTVELDATQYQSTNKAYKKGVFADKTIRVYYAGNTKFISRDGNTMNEDEVSNNDEKVTIENVQVRFGSRYEADAKSTITDNKWKF